MNERRSCRRHAGYSLLEVMVALGVLSIGMLGLAGMQVVTLKNSTGSYMRSQAAVFAQDLADRMRANPAGVVAGSYLVPNPNTAPTNPGISCNGSNCSSTQMAQVDLWQWYSGGLTVLPRLKVQTACTPPTAGVCPGAANAIRTITVMWDETHTGIPTGTGCNPANTTNPPAATDDLLCYRLSFVP